jgi:hypothetical protein
MDGLYVFNNPWAIQSMEKQTTYCAMMTLGLPVPDTWLIPPKSYEPRDDLQATLDRYARLFDLGSIGRELGFPLFIKPYDGGAWVGVAKIDSEEQLQKAYDESGTKVMQLQKAVLPFDYFVRAVGLGPQVRIIRYDPDAPLHARYCTDLEDMTLTINAFFGWDFNSCEALRADGDWHPIDFANACPDSQVTSLHFHFPWLVMANIRWSVFCAAVKRPMRRTHDWSPFYEIAGQDLPYRDRLRAYARVARQRLDADRFKEFCSQHLGHLDEVAWEFFGSPTARDAVYQKVRALFPEHEWDQFTEHFWQLIQQWRRREEEKRSAEP